MKRASHKKHLRERVGVPRGLLHHITLDIINREPMSGSELMDEIEYYTDWRPSPGSIYPVLSKLEKEGLIEIVESQDRPLKRYALTPAGRTVVEDHRRHAYPHVKSRFHSLQKTYWILFEGMPEDVFEAFSTFLETVEKTPSLLESNPEASSKIQDVLRDTTKKIEEIRRQM
jgi:DNA-binding PadR family transcriptional regulator